MKVYYFKWVQVVETVDFKIYKYSQTSFTEFYDRVDFGNQKSEIIKTSFFTVLLGGLMKRSVETNGTSLILPFL